MKYIIGFGIILLILFLPFYINIKVMKTKKENVFKIGIGILDNKLKLFYKINQKKLKEKIRIKLNKNFYTYLEKKNDSFYNDKNKNIIFFKLLLNHLSIKVLIIETRLGLQDAAQTAIITGIISSIKSYFVAYLKSKIEVDNVSFKVLPIFCINTVEVNFNCIIKYKLVYIITAGLNCLKVKKKVVN